MGNRYYEERYPDWLSFTQTWGNKPGLGKWYKRQLHKCERRFGRALCRYGDQAWQHMQRLPNLYSEVSWKGW